MYVMFKNNTSSKSLLFTNTIYQLIGKILSMLITVLATVVIARIYGRESYGAFNLMQAWPAFVFIIVDFGFNAIAVKEISKNWNLAEKYFNSVLILRLCLSAFFIITMAIALTFIDYPEILRQGIRLNLFLILTQSLFATTNIIFQSKLRYDLSTIGYCAGYIFILAAIICMSVLRIPVEWISFSYVIGGLITFLINLNFVEKLGIRINLKLVDFTFIKKIVSQSFPLGLMFLFSQLNFKSDSLMMSVLNLPSRYNLNNTESVAIYGLAYKIFEVALVVPTFFMNAAYPVLVKHMQESKIKLKKTIIYLMFILGFGAILVSLVGILFSPLAVKIVGGADFDDSILVLQILLSGLVFYFLTQPLSWLLVTLDKQKYLPVIYLISAIFNLSANYIYIQKYSFYASSVITHISEMLILILLVIFVRKAWKEKYG